MDFLLRTDTSLSEFLSHIIPHNALTIALFSFFSLVGGSVFVWLMVMGIIIWLEERENKAFILYLLTSLFSVSFIVHYVLKWWFMRVRPYIQGNFAAPACPSDYSFPSGHAAVAFAAAVILASFDKKRQNIYYGAAIIISYSRIFLYCHFVGDVIAGALMGWLISYIIIRFSIPYGRRRSNPR